VQDLTPADATSTFGWSAISLIAFGGGIAALYLEQVGVGLGFFAVSAIASQLSVRRLSSAGPR